MPPAAELFRSPPEALLMAKLKLNGDRLIRLPIVDTKANYLDGFWQWVQLLAADDYQGALEALHWPDGTSWTPEKSYRDMRLAYLNLIGSYLTAAAQMNMAVGKEVCYESPRSFVPPAGAAGVGQRLRQI